MILVLSVLIVYHNMHSTNLYSENEICQSVLLGKCHQAPYY